VPPVSHLTPCTPTKSNLYPDNSLVAAVSEPALYWLLTFHIPNRMYLFRCFGRTEVLIQVPCKRSCFAKKPVFYGEELSTLRPTNPAGGPPLVGCPRLLIQYIRRYPPYGRPVLHPQPEDAPCCGDRVSIITAQNSY